MFSFSKNKNSPKNLKVMLKTQKKNENIAYASLFPTRRYITRLQMTKETKMAIQVSVWKGNKSDCHRGKGDGFESRKQAV